MVVLKEGAQREDGKSGGQRGVRLDGLVLDDCELLALCTGRAGGEQTTLRSVPPPPVQFPVIRGRQDLCPVPGSAGLSRGGACATAVAAAGICHEAKHKARERLGARLSYRANDSDGRVLGGQLSALTRLLAARPAATGDVSQAQAPPAAVHPGGCDNNSTRALGGRLWTHHKEMMKNERLQGRGGQPLVILHGRGSGSPPRAARAARA